MPTQVDNDFAVLVRLLGLRRLFPHFRFWQMMMMPYSSSSLASFFLFPDSSLLSRPLILAIYLPPKKLSPLWPD